MELVQEQLKYRRFFFSTPIVLIHIRGEYKLVDGQHRLAAINYLQHYGDISALEIQVMIYSCGEDVILAERIYLQCNNQYVPNGAIDRSSGTLYKSTFSAGKEVVAEMKRLYPSQIGRNAPNFELNVFEEELNRSKLLERKSGSEIIAIITAENEKFGFYLQMQDSAKHAKCSSGFYLSYKSSKCKWLRDIASRY